MMKRAELRRVARRLKLGRLLYWGWHRPRGAVNRYMRGSEASWIDMQRTAMETAAWKLPVFHGWESNEAPFDVHFLSGKRYWHESAFCFWSLCRVTQAPIRMVIHDDGTFPGDALKHIRRTFPHVLFHSASAIERRLDKHLPSDRFPTLREWRIRQPLLRKLTDLHAGSSGWKMLLDSDMLFYRSPEFLLQWLGCHRKKPLYMVDVQNAYGFSHRLRHGIVQKTIHDRINIGIFGLHSEDVDFDHLEEWLSKLLRYESAPYNLTQGLTSMLLAGVDCDVAPETDYIVLPSHGESVRPTAVLHHFVAESRRWYYECGVPHVQRLIGGGA